MIMEDFVSYLLYLVVFAISIFFSRQYDKRKNSIIGWKSKMVYCILITLPVIFLQGFRYDVGTDYLSYASLYRGFSEGNEIFASWYANEPLFTLTCRIVYFISNGNQTAFFLTDAVLMNVLLFFAFDYYKDQVSLPVMYTFYYLLCFPYFLNIERQGLAVIIIWYAMRYVHEKKLLKFFFCIFIATLFHNTAIFGLVLYFINFLKGKFRVYIKFLVIVVAFFSPFIINWSINFLSNNVELFQKYLKFLRTDIMGELETVNTNFLYMALLMAVLLLMIRFLKRMGLDLFWISFLCAAQMFSYLLNNYIDWGFRMSFYFEFGVMYSYSFVYTKLKYRVNRLVLLAFIAVLLMFYFTYKFYIQGNCEIFPYQFIWSEH